jgi:hypothetical protein
VHLEHLAHDLSGWTDIHDGLHCVQNCIRCHAQHLHVANHTWSVHRPWHERTCEVFTCDTCNRVVTTDHDTDASVDNRTFFRNSEGCAFRGRVCSKCGFFPRFVSGAFGVPVPADSGFSSHRWTNSLVPGGTRRCSDCGLQQWLPSNGVHACMQNTSIIRNRYYEGGQFFFACVTVCSTCTLVPSVRQLTCYDNPHPDCSIHNATADIRFRLDMQRPPGYHP